QRVHNDPPDLESVAGKQPDAAVALVSSLLQRDPSSRPKAAEVEPVLAEQAMPRAAATVIGESGAKSAAMTTKALPNVHAASAAATVPLKRKRRRWPIALLLAGLVITALAAAAMVVLRDGASATA